ncbi:MAG TPA: sulfite exporter TauE/SafE family protein [Acidimicrobiales bacterium]|nr:sulfite exporter TauE/SafE family protein [Acidimicrobiales bacterium]
MDTTPLHGVLTVVAGVLTGILSAAFGVGGAVISTPAIRLLGVSAIFAVGTTLPAILPSAATGTISYAAKSLVRWSVVVWAGGAGVVAAVVGSLLSHRVPGEGHWLMIATAGLVGVTAWRMGTREETAAAVEEGDQPPIRSGGERDRPVVLAGIGAGAGLLSGLLGVGGGVLLIPGFSEIARLPLKVTIATSLTCVGVLAVPSTLVHWGLGDIDWRTAVLLTVGVIPGARLGAALAIKAKDARLRLAVALFLGAVAVAYAVGEAAALVSS